MRLLLLLLLAWPAMAQAVLDVAAVPGLTEEGRAAYASFLETNLPRAFAIGGSGNYGASTAGNLQPQSYKRRHWKDARSGAQPIAGFTRSTSMSWANR